MALYKLFEPTLEVLPIAVFWSPVVTAANASAPIAVLKFALAEPVGPVAWLPALTPSAVL